MIKPGIDATLNVMNGLLDEKGEHLSNLEQGNLDSLMEECGVKTSQKAKDDFTTQVNYFFYCK